jgi:hypothetical protein
MQSKFYGVRGQLFISNINNKLQIYKYVVSCRLQRICAPDDFRWEAIVFKE